MAELTAFEALRYDFEALGGNVSDRIAPPYDVLDQSDKDRLLERDHRNVVAVDLPHVPPKSLGPEEVYVRAGDLLQSWVRDGVLVRETAPALYAYHQVFEYGGRSYTRKMFFARLRLEPFDAGIVLPHEETFGGPKEDRLALMKATRANLSPVFGLYRDPGGAVSAALATTTERAPDAVGPVDDVDNRVWIVKDDDVINRVAAAFVNLKVYIADGHHRYTTALTYRDWVAERAGGSLAPDHPANFVLVAMASMDDPGCLILPTHRVLVGTGDMPLAALLSAWSAGCAETTPDDADITLRHGQSGATVHVHFTNREVLASLEPGKSAAWRALDVAYLHRYLIDELLARSSGAGDPPDLRYVKLERDAVRTAEAAGGIALICKGTTMGQLCAISEAGDRMPQKSTFFYPKIATGLTINPLQ